jgi:hypothetical protein
VQAGSDGRALGHLELAVKLVAEAERGEAPATPTKVSPSQARADSGDSMS